MDRPVAKKQRGEARGSQKQSAAQTGKDLTTFVSDLLLEADVLLADGNIEEARAKLTEALGCLPLGDERRATVRYHLGLLELEADHYEAALSHFSEARRAYAKAGLSERVRACRWGKVSAKFGLGQWETALSELVSLKSEYEKLGQDDFASWVARLGEALEAELPEREVVHIARARPTARAQADEEQMLSRLLSKLRRLENAEQQ